MSLRTTEPVDATFAVFRGGTDGGRMDEEHSVGDTGSPRALLDAAFGGSEAAVRRLFAEHFEGVYAFLRMAMPDPDAAELAAVESLTAAIERREECPERRDEVDPWLRGLALEEIAAQARRPPAAGAAAEQAGGPATDRLEELLAGVSDTALGALVRALEPRSRQAVVLGLMSGLDDRTVALVAGLDAAEVPGLQLAGLAEIARLLERYREGSEEIGRMARELAYHVRAQPGPMSDGMLVVHGSKLMVTEGPTSGFWYMARRALGRLLERLLHRDHSSLDIDVGGDAPPRAPRATPSQRPLPRPDPTPSMTDYDAPGRTPGMGAYRQPKGTPSTQRLSSSQRPGRRR